MHYSLHSKRENSRWSRDIKTLVEITEVNLMPKPRCGVCPWCIVPCALLFPHIPTRSSLRVCGRAFRNIQMSFPGKKRKIEKNRAEEDEPVGSDSEESWDDGLEGEAYSIDDDDREFEEVDKFLVQVIEQFQADLHEVGNVRLTDLIC